MSQENTALTPMQFIGRRDRTATSTGGVVSRDGNGEVGYSDLIRAAMKDIEEGKPTGEIASSVLTVLSAMPRIVATDNNMPHRAGKTDKEIAAGIELRKMLSTLDIQPNNVVPKAKLESIKAAFWWYKEDDLLGGLIDMKADFGSLGMTLSCKPVSNTLLEQTHNVNPDDLALEQATFQRTLDQICREKDIGNLIWTLMRDFFVCQSMILYWKVPGKTDKIEPVASDGTGKESKAKAVNPNEQLIPGLIEIAAIDPQDVDWDNSLGADNLQVAIPEAVIKRIQTVNNITESGVKKQKLSELVNDGIPTKYIDAVTQGKSMVSLDREDGDNWIIKARQRRHHGLADPSMYSIYKYLAVRRILGDADFAISSRMKHFIFHATRGESVPSGPLAGQRTTWATAKEIMELLDIIVSPTRMASVVTDHTVKFNFVLPPNDALSEERYASCDNKIYNWSGVSIVLYTGGGGKYASGYIGIKRLLAQLITVRKMIDELVIQFFGHITISTAMSKPEYLDVGVTFDTNVLKEPSQILDELKILLAEGIGDPQMALAETGRDVSAYRRSKQESIRENETSQVWQKIGQLANDAANGTANGAGDVKKEVGRPANSGTVTSDATKNQDPVPSTNSGTGS
jgi:hypothetical protein